MDGIAHSDRAQYLQRLGLATHAAKHIARYVERTGGDIAAAGAAEGVAKLLECLREATWFQLDCSARRIETKSGCRQGGCQFGALLLFSTRATGSPSCRSELGWGKRGLL